MTLSVPAVDAFIVGALIALYERAVGFYASLVNINAYHQPGVEAGKKAAARVLALQSEVRAALGGEGQTAEQIAAAVQRRCGRRLPCLESFGGKLVRRCEKSSASTPGAETFRVL